MDRYLDVTIDSDKLLTASGEHVIVSNLTLLGGDANDDDTIDPLDAGIIGGAYGTSLGGSNWKTMADINADNTVDILDLVLMGGNYGKSSDTAYSGWTP